MICPECGREIPANGKFCPGCGQPVVESDSRAVIQSAGQGEAPVKVNQGVKYLVMLMAAVVAVIMVLLGLILTSQQHKDPGEESSREAHSEDVEVAANEDGLTGEETETEEEAAEEEPQEASGIDVILVAAPADYMNLRQSPGLGEDSIGEVRAGQYLHWKGEAVTEGERNFYKVTVEETGQEGYLNADYCIRVDYRDDPGLMSVVDVTDALYTYDRMKEDIETLCTIYEECLSCEVVGNSVDGREIYEVSLGSPDAEHHIFVQAAIHGREYMTAQLVMRMLEYYAANYDCGSYRGKSYRELLEHTAIHVIPMSNPDGVTISQLGTAAMYHEEIGQLVYDCYLRDQEYLVLEEDSNGDWNWADYYTQEGFDREAEGKTEIISFEAYQRVWKSNANGVDLNNNFDAGWEAIALRTQPAYSNYKGLYAVSEPETQTLVQEAQRRDYDYYLSYHSKGQLIYYDVNGNTKETSEKSSALAIDLQKIIKYSPVNTQKGYNVNLGGFGDWVQLNLQGASVTIENGRHPCPLAIEEFDAIWYRNRESWAMLCEGLYEQEAGKQQ